jgi:hypothetical protein
MANSVEHPSTAVTFEIGPGDIVIDVDYDFFFDCEETVVDAPWKKLSMAPPPSELIECYDRLKFRHIVAHDEALEACINQDIRDAICIHFDYHHDWHIAPDLLDVLSLGSLDGAITCGNYAAIGAKAGIFRKFVWVYPDDHHDVGAIKLPQSLEHCGVQALAIPYSDYKTLIYPQINVDKIKMAIMCLSPDFVPENYIRNFFSTFHCEKEFQYRALDYAFEAVVSGRRNCQKKYFRLNLSNRAVSLFHGSPLPGLKALCGETGRVHASPSSAFAACYGLKPDTDRGWFQGIDHIAQDRETVFVIAPDYQEILDGQKATLYLIDGNSSLITGRGGCKDHDLILKAPVPIAAETAVDDVRQYLLQRRVIIPGSDSRIDISPLPVDTGAQQAFCGWMDMPWEALTLLRSTPFQLMVFTHLRTQEAWQQFFPLVYWQRLASRCLYPLVPGSLCSTEDDGYHGLSHGLETALIAVIISYALGVPAVHAFLAALCHDLKPHKPGKGLVAAESAEIFAALLDGAWRDYSGAHDQRMVDAVRGHSELSPVKDDVAIVLRDADRVRLSWERGYAPQFFSTETGKEIARNGANYLGELQARLMFSNNVLLEVHPLPSGNELMLWHLGRRYKLGDNGSVSRGHLNYLAALYNVSGLILFPGEADDQDCISSALPSDLPVIWVRYLQGAADVVDLKDERDPPRNAISVLRANASLDRDSLNRLRDLPGNLHLEVGHENLGWICDNLLKLASMDAALVYCRDPHEDDGDELRFVAQALLLKKRKNLDLSSVRLIAPQSWCWLDRPEAVFVVLAAAKDSYSPLTAAVGPRFVGDVFERTLEDVRRRRERCANCCLSINCVSSDFASTDGDAIKMPSNAALFRNWAPYSAS